MRNMWILQSIFVCVTFVARSQAADHWSYTGGHGPSHWPAEFCSGTHQSPINIDTNDVSYDNFLKDVDPITIKHGSTMSMANNGHTVHLTPTATVHMAGAGLGDDYHVVGPHFHWGNTNQEGSEHRIDNKAFPLEMHIVTYNVESYVDVRSAVESGDPNALAVFGVLFELQAENNTAYQPIIENLDAVREVGSTTVDVTLDLKTLLPQLTKDYYRYQGSLTTPNCNEVVIWTLFDTHVGISQYQLDKFRKVLDTEGAPLVNNYRPLQKLNDRVVYQSFKHPSYDVGDREVTDDYDSHGNVISLSYLCGLVVALCSWKLAEGFF